VVTVNLVAAAPFDPAVGQVLVVDGPLSFVGAGLMTGAAARALATLMRLAGRPPAPAPA
jgi:hypothetical protein